MLKNPSLLGDLQQKILRHLFECKEKDESASHISRQLDTLQPAVFRSIKSLMSEGYLTKVEGYRGGEKLIYLTPKGAATATLLEIARKQFENYTNKNSNNSLPDLQRFLNSIRAPSKQDFLYRQLMKFFLEKDVSDIQKENNGSLFTMFLTKIAPEILSEVATIFDDVHNVKEFVDKYNLDKDLLKNLLEERRHNIDSLLYRLDKQENNLKSQSVKHGLPKGPYAARLVAKRKPPQQTNEEEDDKVKRRLEDQLSGQKPELESIRLHLGNKETIRIAKKALKDGFEHFIVKIDPRTHKVTGMDVPSKIKSSVVA